MNRVQLKNTPTAGTIFTFSLNPAFVDFKDDNLSNVAQILDAGAVIQNAYFDGRPIELTWKNIPVDFQNFGSMIASLWEFKGDIKYANYADIDYRSEATIWNKVLVGNLDKKMAPGGKLKYSSITLYLYPQL